MRRAAQLPTLSWHGRSSAVGLPPCSLPPQDLGRVLDGGPIRHGVDSQQLVVPGSPPTACTGIQQGCQLVCPAAGTFWWCWLSPFVRHRVNENHGDPLTPGALSRWLLWGESRSLARNTAAFRRRFRLQ